MVLRCGDLSHVVEVDKNDFIWQLPPKKSVVRWLSSSSITTPVSKNNRHGKQRPRGILKSSPGKIRNRDHNNDDEDDDARDGSSSPRSQQSSTMAMAAGRDDSCYSDDYPLAHLEHAGHTPRGNSAQLSLLSFSSSSPPHRRGRAQSEPNFTSIHRSNNKHNGNIHIDTENDRHTSQP